MFYIYEYWIFSSTVNFLHERNSNQEFDLSNSETSFLGASKQFRKTDSMKNVSGISILIVFISAHSPRALHSETEKELQLTKSNFAST